MTGRVVHFDIPYRNPEVLSAFYTDVFDWQLWPVEDLNYIGLSTGPTGADGLPSGPGYIGGGLSAARTTSDRPRIVIDVDDLDDALARVVDAGGSVVLQRTDVGELGCVAYFADPEGNILGLWQTRELG